MRAAEEGGLTAGCRALRRRFVRCRPRYSVRYDHSSLDWRVRLADGSDAGSDEVADFVLEPYRAALVRSEALARVESATFTKPVLEEG
jgi:hypothetical protein